MLAVVALLTVSSASPVLSAEKTETAPEKKQYQQKYRFDQAIAGVPESRYTSFILDLARRGPSKTDQSETLSGDSVTIQCLETLDNPDYIGLKQEMVIHAPLKAVEAVLDDFDHYKELFPGFKDVHVVDRDANRITTYWEQKIPVFFIPNIKYELVYFLDKSKPSVRMYRYHLKEESKIKAVDGIIILEDKGPRNTYYTEYDFYDAHWGILKTIAPKRIWKDTVEGIVLSDLAIKLKAENPTWSYDKVAEESRNNLEVHPVEQAIAQKKLFKKFANTNSKDKSLGVKKAREEKIPPLACNIRLKKRG